MYYVPNFQDYACVNIRNQEVMRAYKTLPTNNSNIDYDDYYYNSHYFSHSGTETFNQFSTLPDCIDSSLLTDNFYYRNDFDNILIVFVIISIIVITLPLKLFHVIFRRGI